MSTINASKLTALVTNSDMDGLMANYRRIVIVTTGKVNGSRILTTFYTDCPESEIPSVCNDVLSEQVPAHGNAPTVVGAVTVERYY